MRVFLDTNVLISAFTTRGLCEDVVREVLASHDLIISALLLKEINQVLREKFKIPRSLAAEIVSFLREDSILSKPGKLPPVRLKDQSDMGLLSCALEGRADVFVTGDKELIDLHVVESFEIISPRGFWDKLKKA
jgi:putative PIN family toxin of toxin-antitoxin system